MANKKEKKYQQSIAAPRFGPTQGTNFVQELQGLIVRLFGEPQPHEPTRREIIDYHLTYREREVAYLAALGFSDKEIANSLGLTSQNVRQHLQNTLRKLKMHSVLELRQYFSPRDW